MSAETIPADVLYLIRKGGLFYRPNSQGYTAHTFDAGRYTLAEAEAITHPNGPDGPRDGLSYVPAPADHSTRPAEPAAPVAEAGDGEVSRYIAKCREMSKGENGHTYTWWSRLADLLSTLEAERARADAAEQRAADTLARAEKAEGALETAQKERKAASEAMRHVGAHFPECAAEFDAIMDRNATRASREAQPATDGGDNG